MSAMSDQVYALDSSAGGPLELLKGGIDRPLRWAAWRPDGSSCLLVGNRGSAVLYDPAVSLRAGPSASLRTGGQAFSPLDTKTKHNLRGVAFSPDGKQALLVGNRGAVLLYQGSSMRDLPSPTHENLRRVAWHPDGASALIVGNAGTVLRYDSSASLRTGGDELTPVPGDRAHTLRAVAWRPDGAYALVGAYASSWAGYPRPHALYKCDGAYLQALLTSDVEDDFVAIDWHPDGKRALVAGYAYQGRTSSNKLLIYDGEGFAYQPVEASASLLGAAWQPSGEYALLCGEGGLLLRYTGSEVEQLDSGTKDNLVGPFWMPDGSRALFLRGPGERVYTV